MNRSATPRALFGSHLILTALLLVQTALYAHSSHAATSAAQVTQDGKGLYMVLFVNAAVEEQDAEGEPEARPPGDRQNRYDVYGWHKPKTRKLVKTFEREFGLKARVITSHTLPAFSAFIPEATLELLRNDPRVRSVSPVESANDFVGWVDNWTDLVRADLARLFRGVDVRPWRTRIRFSTLGSDLQPKM